jgi:hypothetical protein
MFLISERHFEIPIPLLFLTLKQAALIGRFDYWDPTRYFT